MADAATIHVNLGARSYAIRFDVLDRCAAAMENAGLVPGRCIVVTDTNVGARYAKPLVRTLRARGWQPHVITCPVGETSKSIEQLSQLWAEILGLGIDRKTPVLALGGGVVGDLAGFAAASVLRGVPLVQIPTSLIAQVDSAIGGKTGINHATGKNLIGAFHQPKLVFADPAVLQTLPMREWTSGLAEVVKHALIASPSFFRFLNSNWTAILARDTELVHEMVARAAQIKSKVVAEDETEQGRRAILNFGHTFGHAIEREAGYGAFTHGEAVSLGMRAALHLSAKLYPHADFNAAHALAHQLPVEPDPSILDVPTLTQAMYFDKKVKQGRLRFVVLDELGHALVREVNDEALLAECWAAALS
ncbi:MAG: 3-dehydroquinate synthase [Rhodothermales bacterium]